MMDRKIRLAVLLALAFASPARVSAAAADPSFDRLLPGDYREMLLRGKRAYEGKRFDEAFQAFQRTACGGDKESQSMLGRMYLLGQGVGRDDLTGYAWLKVAAEVRQRGYQAIVDKIENAMKPEQRRLADPEAARLVDLYGLRATKMSCNLHATQGGHILDSVMCTPKDDGPNLLLKRCTVGTPLPHR
jgi:TPR repeat protein